MEKDKAISEIAREIVNMFPIAQMQTAAATYKRSKVYGLIFRHVSSVRAGLQDKINELDRQLYIAKKRIEDDALDQK